MNEYRYLSNYQMIEYTEQRTGEILHMIRQENLAKEARRSKMVAAGRMALQAAILVAANVPALLFLLK